MLMFSADHTMVLFSLPKLKFARKIGLKYNSKIVLCIPFTAWLLLLLLLQPFYDPLYRVSRYHKKHSSTYISWSSSNLYQLLPSTMIHSVIPVQFTCWTIFLRILSPNPKINKWSKEFDIRPHRRGKWMVQLYSPGGVNMHPRYWKPKTVTISASLRTSK